jgi:hypothetical protein
MALVDLRTRRLWVGRSLVRRALMKSFTDQPRRPPNTSCLGDLVVPTFVETPEASQFFFGVDDLWENAAPARSGSLSRSARPAVAVAASASRASVNSPLLQRLERVVERAAARDRPEQWAAAGLPYGLPPAPR